MLSTGVQLFMPLNIERFELKLLGRINIFLQTDGHFWKAFLLAKCVLKRTAR
jgi:hypothetical protein